MAATLLAVVGWGSVRLTIQVTAVERGIKAKIVKRATYRICGRALLSAACTKSAPAPRAAPCQRK
jgi:hypothetical protein